MCYSIYHYFNKRFYLLDFAIYTRDICILGPHNAHAYVRCVCGGYFCSGDGVLNFPFGMSVQLKGPKIGA